MKTMQLREAKAKLSAVVEAAANGEATTITRHGERVAMVIPIAKGDELYSADSNRAFIEHLMAFPDAGIDFDEIRGQFPVKDVDFDL